MFLFIFSFKKKSTKTIPLAQDPKNILKQILCSQHFFRPVIMLHDHELWSCCLIMVPWSCCLIMSCDHVALSWSRTLVAWSLVPWSCCLIMGCDHVAWSWSRNHVSWSLVVIMLPNHGLMIMLPDQCPMIMLPYHWSREGWSYDHYSLWRMVLWSLFPVEDGPMIIIPCVGWSYDHYSLWRMVLCSLFPVEDGPMIIIPCAGWSHDHYSLCRIILWSELPVEDGPMIINVI